MVMTKHEKELLMERLGEVLAMGELTEEQTVAEMTQIVRRSYDAGMQTQLSPLAYVSPLVTAASIDTATAAMAARVGALWAALGDELTETITEGIKAGKSYTEVSADVDDLIRRGWGDTVHFNNIGRIVEKVKVDPFTGETEIYEHEIQAAKTINTKSYATTLSQTVVHESWGKARDDQLDSVGVEKFVYSSVADAATRPDHLAMHGTIIARGSAEEKKADMLMRDYNCRCLKLPHWDDPDFDTPPEVYEKQKKEAAEKLREVTPDNTVEADTLDAIIGKETPEELRTRVANECGMQILGSKKHTATIAGLHAARDALREGAEDHKKYLDKLARTIRADKGVHARLDNLGIPSTRAARSMAENLRDNFVYGGNPPMWSFEHAAGKHAGDFTLSEVIRLNAKPSHLYRDIDGSEKILSPRKNGNYLYIVRGRDPDKTDKVITAYTLKKKSAEKIMQRAERIL